MGEQGGGRKREGVENYLCDGLKRLELTGNVKFNCSGRLMVDIAETACVGRDAVSAMVKSTSSRNAKLTAL